MNRKKTRDALIALEIEADCLPDDEQWNLRGANLYEADLHGADLHGADLREADLPYIHRWLIAWNTNGLIKIGCKENTVAGWDEWFAGTETYSTARNTEDFERIEAGYQHAKRMVEIWHKYHPEVKE